MLFWLIPYQFLFPLIVVGVAIQFLATGRGRTLREGWDQIRQRLGRLSAPETGKLDGTVLWIHAASIGEVNASAPLIRKLTDHPKPARILLTTSTVVGRARAQEIPQVALASLAPMDFYPAVASFLRDARPKALILVETELWPMTLWTARRRKIPVVIVNGRLSERSYRRYLWIRPLIRPLLRSVSVAVVQTEQDAARFRDLGVPESRVNVAGNLKDDLPFPGDAIASLGESQLRTLGWENDPVWVAGSTRPGEEQAVLESFRELRKKHPRLRLVLAPRHVERASEVASLLNGAMISYTASSSLEVRENASAEEAIDCLLLDQLGHLLEWYSTAAVAFVGGTLVPIGGHNLLEPAMSGIPVLYGPHVESQARSARALQESGGGIAVADSAGLTREIDRFLFNEAARKETGRKALAAARRLAGATERTIRWIEPALPRL